MLYRWIFAVCSEVYKNTSVFCEQNLHNVKVTYRDVCCNCCQTNQLPVKLVLLFITCLHTYLKIFSSKTLQSYAPSQNCEKRSDSRLRHAGLLVRLSVSVWVCPSVSLSVYLSAWKGSVHTERIFINFNIWEFFSKICRENWNYIKIRQE